MTDEQEAECVMEMVKLEEAVITFINLQFGETVTPLQDGTLEDRIEWCKEQIKSCF